jgi:hypothetical protein
MPMGEVELWRSAADLISAHGDEAAARALALADAALDDGDINGFSSWKKVARLIAQMQSDTPRGDAHGD